LNIYFKSNYIFTYYFGYFWTHQVDQVILNKFPHDLKLIFTIKKILVTSKYFFIYNIFYSTHNIDRSCYLVSSGYPECLCCPLYTMARDLSMSLSLCWQDVNCPLPAPLTVQFEWPFYKNLLLARSFLTLKFISLIWAIKVVF
jgi:hypothetical protein